MKEILRKVFISASAILILGMVLFLHQTSQQFFGIAYLLGLLALFIKSIVDATKKQYHLSIMFLVALALFITQYETFRNTLIPVIKSPNIEISYNLKSPDFTDDNKTTIKASTGDNITFERMPESINYSIYLPHPIEDVDTFYTSYDNAGQHIARKTWTKNVDYKFSGNAITSAHQLNDTVNDGKGRHIIVYSYRSPLFEHLFSQAQIFCQNFTTNAEKFIRNYGLLSIVLFVALGIILAFSTLWKTLSPYLDRILLFIIFVIALQLKMQALAITTGLLIIVGAQALKTIVLSFASNIEEINLWGARFKRYPKTASPGELKTNELSSGVSPEEFSKYYQQGNLALSQNDIPLARAMFEKAIELDPNNVQANISLGLVYNMLGENKKSIDFSKKALDLSPDNFVAQFNLAVATNHLLGSEKSLDEYLKAEKIAKENNLPENVTLGKLNLFLGHDYRETGDLDEARKRYRNAELIFKLNDTSEAKFWLKDTYENFKRLGKLEDKGFSSSSAIK